MRRGIISEKRDFAKKLLLNVTERGEQRFAPYRTSIGLAEPASGGLAPVGSGELTVASQQTGNAFLDSLSPASLDALLPLLEPVDAVLGAVVGVAGTVLEYVIFPVSCVISVVARMRDGADIEITVAGREGFYGVHAVLGVDWTPAEAMVQIRNRYLRIRTIDFKQRLEDDRELRTRCLGFVQATMDAVCQFAACNRLHPINERCARWLLMAHDRMPGDEIYLTHEYLATMLGVRRPGVSIAAAVLESAGFIANYRGRIVIKDRAGLEAASCECYTVANDTILRNLGYDIRKTAS